MALSKQPSWKQTSVNYSQIVRQSEYEGISFSQYYSNKGHDKVLNLSGKYNNIINNYGGAKGLTVSEYYAYNQFGWGGVAIDLSYTGPEVDGARWFQHFKTNFPHERISLDHFKTTSYWDTPNGEIGEYLTKSELKEFTNGNTIRFNDSPDRPNSDIPNYLKASLFLFSNDNRLLLKLYYGYSTTGNITIASPLIVGYHRY